MPRVTIPSGWPTRKITDSTNGQSIIPEILRVATGITLPSTSWIKYDAYNSPLRVLFHSIRTAGVEALKQYVARRDSIAKAQRLNEGQMNRIGYWLSLAGQIKEAISVFEQNVADYPSSFNAYDSLGEAYMNDGQKELAIKNYKKSLELNPQKTNAVTMLKKLFQFRVPQPKH